jgi:DNA polymerase elongation subunit (family B)
MNKLYFTRSCISPTSSAKKILNDINNNNNNQTMIQVSIVSIEHTMCQPHATLDFTTSTLFNNRQTKFVPVIHIYGSTPRGQKCCLHIHKCLPYFLVPFPKQVQQRSSFVFNLANEIEKRMEDQRKNSQYYNKNNDKSSWQYIHDIVLVRGIPFYGYWKREELFLKIYVYNPNHIKSIAAMLQSGSIMRHIFQPYEMHIPYILQFMIDYNLVGMGFVDMKKVMFRMPLPSTFQPVKTLDGTAHHVDHNDSSNTTSDPLYLKGNVDLAYCLSGRVDRMSYSDIEADGFCEDILNYGFINTTDIRADNYDINLVQTLSTIWEEEKLRRQRMNLSSELPKPSQSQSRCTPLMTEIQKAMVSRINQLIGEEPASNENISNNSSNDDQLSMYSPANTPYHLINTAIKIVEQQQQQHYVQSEIECEDPEMLDILDWMQNCDTDFVADNNNDNNFCVPYNDDWELNEDDEYVDPKSQEEDEIQRSQKENQDILESYLEETQLERRDKKEFEEYLSQHQANIPQLDGNAEEQQQTDRKRKRVVKGNNANSSKRVKHDYSVGACVYLRPPGYKQGENYYIGCIEKLSNCGTKATIRWLFRPEELPIGVQQWYGKNELFVSEYVLNSLEVLILIFNNSTSDVNQITTIISRVKIRRVEDIYPTDIQDKIYSKQLLDHVDLGSDTFYCRFEYLVQTGKFVALSSNIRDLLFTSDDAIIRNENAANNRTPSISPILALSDSSSNHSSDPNQLASNNNALTNKLNESSILISSSDTLSDGFDNIDVMPGGDDYGGSMENQVYKPLVNLSGDTIQLTYTEKPPSASKLKPSVVHPVPYYSNHRDYLKGQRASELRFRGLGLTNQKQRFPTDLTSSTLPFYSAVSTSNTRRRLDVTNNSIVTQDLLVLEYAILPPSSRHLQKLDKQKQKNKKSDNQPKVNLLNIDGHGRLLIQQETDSQNVPSRPPSPKWDEAMGYTSQTTTVFGSSTYSAAVNFSSIPSEFRVSEEVANSDDNKTPPKLPQNQSALNANIESPLKKKKSQRRSQITLPTSTAKLKEPVTVAKTNFTNNDQKKHQNLIAMSIETHVTTRSDLRPNPIYDPVEALFFCIQNDIQKREYIHGCLIVLDPDPEQRNIRSSVDHIPELHARKYPTEKALLIAFVDLIQYFDPDILTGYDLQTESLGYLIERSSIVLGYNLCTKISRVIHKSTYETHRRDEWGRTKQSGIHIRGRVILNAWRLMRHEVKLNIYTFENVVYNVLGIRYPHFSYQTRTKWFSLSDEDVSQQQHYSVVLRYYMKRARLNLDLLHHLDLINRTCELAKVFGIEFFNVVSRGSQYRVESMMIRLAKPRNYVILSASKQQVFQQNAIECIPLVMEPQSKMYSNPVIVLDFQSLYPSIVIAYNLW